MRDIARSSEQCRVNLTVNAWSASNFRSCCSKNCRQSTTRASPHPHQVSPYYTRLSLAYAPTIHFHIYDYPRPMKIIVQLHFRTIVIAERASDNCDGPRQDRCESQIVNGKEGTCKINVSGCLFSEKFCFASKVQMQPRTLVLPLIDAQNPSGPNLGSRDNNSQHVRNPVLLGSQHSTDFGAMV